MSFEQASTTYTELVQAALENGDAGAWAKLKTANFTVKELQEYAESIGYHVNVNGAGQVVSYTKDVTAPLNTGVVDVGSVINSNLETGTVTASNNVTYQTISDVIPDVAEGATASAESAVNATGTMSKFVDGVKTTLNTQVTPQIGNTVVAGKVLPAVIAAGVGIKLGKGIDSAIYNIGNALGGDNVLGIPIENFNPDAWSVITEDMSSTGAEGVAKWAFNTLFGIDDKGSTTMYVDENAVSYMASFLNKIDWFKGEQLQITGFEAKDVEYTLRYNDYNYSVFSMFMNPFYGSKNKNYYSNVSGYDRTFIYITSYSSQPTVWFSVQTNSDISPMSFFNGYNNTTNDNVGSLYEQVTPHVFQTGYTGYADFEPIYARTSGGTIDAVDVINILYNNALAIIKSLSPDGITDLDGATQPDISGADTPDDALTILKELYPELWNNRIENQVVQPDGTTKTYTYLPIPFPTTGTEQKIDTQDAVQTQTEVNPNPDTTTDQKPATESQLWSLIQTITNSLTKPQGMTETEPETQPDGTPLNPDPPINPPDTGTGDTPGFVPVTGSASSLWAIYNPTIAQINDFGAWLWSSDFVDQILKLFNDPMQSIIGLHRIYATPTTGETRTIKVGYLDSGVSSLIVTDQYSTVDCGTVNLREYFGNVFDYEPYTQVQLYLPFIGIVNLDTADVMRSSINVVYHVDVLTGACLAEVKVIRDSAGGTLYQYAGNAAVTMPVSSGSYMGIVASIASIAGGVAGTIASGGALAPMLLGSASSAISSARTKVEHSGGFSGNAGAMGIKKPYLIISRPQAALAKNYQNYIGDPSNTTTTLENCTGYVQVKECHLENISATQQELNNIEQILKGGVLI